MRMENQSLRDGLLAVADAFGGVWQKEGEIYVLKAGTDSPRKGSPAVPEEFGRFDSQVPKQADELEKRMREWSELVPNPKEWRGRLAGRPKIRAAFAIRQVQLGRDAPISAASDAGAHYRAGECCRRRLRDAR